MSKKNGICHLLRSGKGCHFGVKCKFSHDVGSDTSRATTPESSSRRLRDSTASQTANNNRGVPGGDHAPRNICDFYWKTGKCNRSFDCTFRHEQMPNTALNHDNQSSTQSDEDAANSALTFFTAEGLEEVTGVTMHEDHGLKPADAHNSIKTYLRDGYKFRSPSDMLAFVRILASINRRNKAWVSPFHHPERRC